MMVKFVVGIDAGGTKTVARIERIESGEQWNYRGGSASLSNDLNGAKRQISSTLEHLLQKASACSEDTFVVCGIAGAGNMLAREELYAFLGDGYGKLEIVTDARTSLYGAGRGRLIVVIALGTGAVAIRLDSDGERLFGGWGFAIADEGSGAAVGKLAVRETLDEFDRHGAFVSPVTQQLSTIIGSNRKDLISWLKSASPSDFAKLSLIVSEKAESCDVARNILIKAARDVESLINLARGESDLSVSIVGGMATIMIPYLSRETKQLLIPAKGDSLDGACYLARLSAASAGASASQM